ncbi:MAG TPA: hypothetical protein VKV73_23275 [Chloroflexota bacterium]|nr:hypothetical protein [Chloroflexota bacterium]
MPASPSVVKAVEAAIVASAHLAAYEHVAAAAQACQRLGGLAGGRWRSAAGDLSALEEDLQSAFAIAAEAVASCADDIGIPEDALWSVGDAAGTLALLRPAALEEVEAESRAEQVLQGEVLFGTSFVEDPDLPDRGATLLFGWPDPLSPATWPWQANWVVGDGQDNGEEGEANELDLFEAGEPEGDEAMLADLAEELDCSLPEARAALRAAALALTRASLLAGVADDDDEEEEEADDEDTSNGEP